MQTTYHAVNKTWLYSLALKEWRKKAIAEKTWGIFKRIFAEGYNDLVDENKVTTRYASFQSANSM